MKQGTLGTLKPTAPTELNGTFGARTMATLVPCSIEFWLAEETGIGTATPGDFYFAQSVPAVANAYTEFIAYAPNDARKRYIKCRAVQIGYSSSLFTDYVEVDPWNESGLPTSISPVRSGENVTQYVVQADNSEGTTISAGVGTYDGTTNKPIPAVEYGESAHSESVTFTREFQDVPTMIFNGGINYQPGNAWGTIAQVNAGTAVGAVSASLPQYQSLSTFSLSKTGFRGKFVLRQAGTPVSVTNNFSNFTISTIGQSSSKTVNSAPSLDDKYTVRFQYSVYGNPKGTGPWSATCVVAIDENSTGTYVERGTATLEISDWASGFPETVGPFTQTVNITQAGLDFADSIRIRIKDIYETGLWFDGPAWTIEDVVPGISYNTSGVDRFASATSGSGVTVNWKAIGSVTVGG